MDVLVIDSVEMPTPNRSSLAVRLPTIGAWNTSAIRDTAASFDAPLDGLPFASAVFAAVHDRIGHGHGDDHPARQALAAKREGLHRSDAATARALGLISVRTEGSKT